MPRDRAAAAICPVPALHIRHVIYSRKRVKSHVMQYRKIGVSMVISALHNCGGFRLRLTYRSAACGQNDG